VGGTPKVGEKKGPSANDEKQVHPGSGGCGRPDAMVCYAEKTKVVEKDATKEEHRAKKVRRQKKVYATSRTKM